MWSREDLEIMSHMVHPMKYYRSHVHDEEKIDRSARVVQGIFKVWAIPVLSFMYYGRLDVLDALWPRLVEEVKVVGMERALLRIAEEDSVLSATAQEAIQIIERSRIEAAEYPLKLKTFFEEVVEYTRVLDVRMMNMFHQEPLSENVSERISQLIHRLVFSFGLFNPFYNLEVLAGDSNYIYASGDRFSQDKNVGGILDTVVTILVPAFREYVVARGGNWNELSWSKITVIVGEILNNVHNPLRPVLIRVCEVSQLPPDYVLFAVNVIEFLQFKGYQHVDSAISTVRARRDILHLLKRHESLELRGHEILSDINARIRFLNWTPLVKGPQNFKGCRWSYASVCDTANQLFEEIVAHPEVWREDFRVEFLELIVPQLKNLDASSARGRALLQFIFLEGKLAEGVLSKTDAQVHGEWLDLCAKPYDTGKGHILKQSTSFVPALVGGKTMGLALAQLALPKDSVLDGFVFSTSVVQSWLRTDPELMKLITKLETITSKKGMSDLSRQIIETIGNLSVPDWLREVCIGKLYQYPHVVRWAVRSSAVFEKGNQARGTYDSVIDVPSDKVLEAIHTCLASFYSTKAITYRNEVRSSHYPAFAILCLPYFPYQGGVAEHHVGRLIITPVIEIGEHASDVTSGHVKKKLKGRDLKKDPLATKAFEMIEVLRHVYGPVQVEFIQDAPNSDIPLLLQMEKKWDGQVKKWPKKKPPKGTFYFTSNTTVESFSVFMDKHRGTIVIEVSQDIDANAFNDVLSEILTSYYRRIYELKIWGKVAESCHTLTTSRGWGVPYTFHR